MGTRADFYKGKGKDAEWIGSICWDGDPNGAPIDLMKATTEDEYLEHVEKLLSDDENGPTRPDEGWPWPWDNSHTTDFSYAFDLGTVWVSCWGCTWQKESEYDPEFEGEKVEFPDMSDVSKPKLGGPGSGVLIL